MNEAMDMQDPQLLPLGFSCQAEPHSGKGRAFIMGQHHVKRYFRNTSEKKVLTHIL